MPTVENAMSVWDFTCHFTKEDGNYDEPELSDGALTPEKMNKILKEMSKKRVFQLEKGDLTGCVHYQGRVNLLRTHRTRTPWKLFPFQARWSPTSLENTKGDKFYHYCTKDHTRVAGPWSDKDDVAPVYLGNAVKVFRGEQTYNRPVYHDDGSVTFVPEKYDGLRPWHHKMVELLKIPDFRTIHCVVDEIGYNQKTFLVKHMKDVLKPFYVDVPPTMDTADKMMTFCCDIIKGWPEGVHGVFSFDLPRAMKDSGPKEMAALCTALEQIKNGEFYNWKYKAKQVSTENPGVVIFANFFPALAVSRKLLSIDKWCFWSIDESTMKLKKYKYTPPPKEPAPKSKPRKRCLIEADDED